MWSSVRVGFAIALGASASAETVPDAIAQFQRARPRYRGVAYVSATVTWKSAYAMEREGKSPVPMQGLVFDMTFRPGDSPDITMRLTNAPKGVSKEDVENLQFTASGLLLPAFEDPFGSLKEFLESKGATVKTAPDGSIVFRRPGGEGVIFVEHRYKVAPDGTRVDEEKIGDAGIMDRKTTYRFSREGKSCLYVGEHSDQVAGVWRGVDRTIVWQDLDGVPFPETVKEVSRDDTASVKVQTLEVEISNAEVTGN